MGVLNKGQDYGWAVRFWLSPRKQTDYTSALCQLKQPDYGKGNHHRALITDLSPIVCLSASILPFPLPPKRLSSSIFALHHVLFPSSVQCESWEIIPFHNLFSNRSAQILSPRRQWNFDWPTCSQSLTFNKEISNAFDPKVSRRKTGENKDKSQLVIHERHNTLHSVFFRVEGKEQIGSLKYVFLIPGVSGVLLALQLVWVIKWVSLSLFAVYFFVIFLLAHLAHDQ